MNQSEPNLSDAVNLVLMIVLLIFLVLIAQITHLYPGV